MADIYDALTTNRPYRKELSVEDALAIMNNEARDKTPWRNAKSRATDETRIH